MWTPTTRQQHSRTVTRYQTDLTDAEWRVIAPHLPQPCAAGRPRLADARDHQRRLLCHASGLPVAAAAERLSPWGTIYRWFAAWPDDGRFERINHALVTGANATRSSIRTGVASCSNRPASVQDRDGGWALLSLSRRLFPFIERVFADSGYAGEKVAKATLIAVEIVRKNPDQVGFAVNPRRWVVERFFAWIGRNRRLANDFEATINSARAFLYAASKPVVELS